jgi:phosphoribosylformylglycinamidine synthase
MALGGGVGVQVAGIPSHAELFTEAPSRVVAAADGASVDDVRRRAESAGVRATVLGRAGGDRVVIDGLVELPLARLADEQASRLAWTA